MKDLNTVTLDDERRTRLQTYLNPKYDDVCVYPPDSVFVSGNDWLKPGYRPLQVVTRGQKPVKERVEPSLSQDPLIQSCLRELGNYIERMMVPDAPPQPGVAILGPNGIIITVIASVPAPPPVVTTESLIDMSISDTMSVPSQAGEESSNGRTTPSEAGDQPEPRGTDEEGSGEGDDESDANEAANESNNNSGYETAQ